MTIDDNDKQKILDSLSKESTMVIMTAFVYAKTYVEFGEDITKAWTTATQQASILEKVKQKAMVEAYDSFKKDYEGRLKAVMVAILTDLQLDIQEVNTAPQFLTDDNVKDFSECVDTIIQQKINALKENTDDN